MAKRIKTKGQSNDQQNSTQKTKDRETQTPLKTGGELRCSGRVDSSCSTRRVTLVPKATLNFQVTKKRVKITKIVKYNSVIQAVSVKSIL